jgi:hypothetical protein
MSESDVVLEEVEEISWVTLSMLVALAIAAFSYRFYGPENPQPRPEKTQQPKTGQPETPKNEKVIEEEVIVEEKNEVQEAPIIKEYEMEIEEKPEIIETSTVETLGVDSEDVNDLDSIIPGPPSCGDRSDPGSEDLTPESTENCETPQNDSRSSGSSEGPGFEIINRSDVPQQQTIPSEPVIIDEKPIQSDPVIVDEISVEQPKEEKQVEEVQPRVEEILEQKVDSQETPPTNATPDEEDIQNSQFGDETLFTTINSTLNESADDVISGEQSSLLESGEPLTTEEPIIEKEAVEEIIEEPKVESLPEAGVEPKIGEIKVEKTEKVVDLVTERTFVEEVEKSAEPLMKGVEDVQAVVNDIKASGDNLENLDENASSSQLITETLDKIENFIEQTDQTNTSIDTNNAQVSKELFTDNSKSEKVVPDETTGANH